MPRIRTIKPEIASDVGLARVSRESRYTLVMLISQADDQGLLLGNPRQLLGALFPHDEDVSVEVLHGWLAELEAEGIIRWRARKDGAPVVQVVNWQRHQKVDHPHKPVLLEALLPEDDPQAAAFLAKVSRNPRENLATPSRTDHTTLQPRDLTTNDPTTSSRASQKARSTGEGERVTWVTPALEAWEAAYGVGSFDIGQGLRELAPLYRKGDGLTPEDIGRRLEFYIRQRGLEGTPSREQIARANFRPSLRDFRLRHGAFNPDAPAEAA